MDQYSRNYVTLGNAKDEATLQDVAKYQNPIQHNDPDSFMEERVNEEEFSRFQMDTTEQSYGKEFNDFKKFSGCVSDITAVCNPYSDNTNVNHEQNSNGFPNYFDLNSTELSNKAPLIQQLDSINLSNHFNQPNTYFYSTSTNNYYKTQEGDFEGSCLSYRQHSNNMTSSTFYQPKTTARPYKKTSKTEMDTELYRIKRLKNNESVRKFRCEEKRKQEKKNKEYEWMKQRICELEYQLEIEKTARKRDLEVIGQWKYGHAV